MSQGRGVVATVRNEMGIWAKSETSIQYMSPVKRTQWTARGGIQNGPTYCHLLGILCFLCLLIPGSAELAVLGPSKGALSPGGRASASLTVSCGRTAQALQALCALRLAGGKRGLHFGRGNQPWSSGEGRAAFLEKE